MTHTTVDDYVASVPAPLIGVVAVLRELPCGELASAEWQRQAGDLEYRSALLAG
jgi:hypothetical protein